MHNVAPMRDAYRSEEGAKDERLVHGLKVRRAIRRLLLPPCRQCRHHISPITLAERTEHREKLVDAQRQ